MATREVRPPSRRPHVAVFDAMTLTAKSLKEQLVARKFPTASLRLFTSSTNPEANLTEFGGEAMLVTVPEVDTLVGLDIAFFCGSRREGAVYRDWPGRAGFVAIDLTSASMDAPGVPVVNARVNPEAIGDRPRLIAAPQPAAQMLSSLLAPVQRRLGLKACVAVVLQPASECGEAGIEELYQQTVGLLNFQETPHAVFGRQLAFNVIPAALYADGEVPGGSSPAGVERELRSILGGRFDLSVEIALAPVFHCHAAAVHLVLEQGAGRESLLECFQDREEFRVGPVRGPATPVELAGDQTIMVAGLREAGPSSFWLWAVADNLAAGMALNAVQIAEVLVERGAGRGLA